MDWFLYDNGLRHERVNLERLLHIFFVCSSTCHFINTISHILYKCIGNTFQIHNFILHITYNLQLTTYIISDL